jgi:hypothetical protein
MALTTDEIYEKTIDFAKNVEDNFLDLAKSLRQLRDRDPELVRKVWSKTGLGSRKAYYLINIDEQFSGLPVGKARLKKLGWTKLQLIGQNINADNADELLTMAENHTAAQLKQLVKGEKPVTNAHCMVLYFSQEQYAELEPILLANGGTKSGRGILDKERALLNALGIESTKSKKKS